MSSRQQSTQLDNMLQRTFDRQEWSKFLTLSRHKLRRLRREADSPTKAKRFALWKLLRQLPEIRQQQRIAAKLAERGNSNE